MRGCDAIYTPEWIADEIASHLSLRENGAASLVADYAAGDGALLNSVVKRWPDVGVVASDVDRSAMRRLARRHPTWHVGSCNFLEEKSRQRSPILESLVDAAVLNPPFSCRGHAATSGVAFGEPFRCSPGAAFLLFALERLLPHGKLVAVLPSGSLTSEKDERAHALLRAHSEVEVLRTFHLRAFRGGHANTTLLAFTRRRMRASASASSGRARRRKDSLGTVKLVRGTSQMHRASGGRYPVIHTTQLHDFAVTFPSASRADDSRIMRGPAILLPRVGAPRIDKVALYLKSSRAVLSDCVFGLIPPDEESAAQIHARLLERWKELERAYVGSCAPYLTVRRLIETLGTMGIEVADS